MKSEEDVVRVPQCSMLTIACQIGQVDDEELQVAVIGHRLMNHARQKFVELHQRVSIVHLKNLAQLKFEKHYPLSPMLEASNGQGLPDRTVHESETRQSCFGESAWLDPSSEEGFYRPALPSAT